jgi:hypothetical protein
MPNRNGRREERTIAEGKLALRECSHLRWIDEQRELTSSIIASQQ